MVRFRGIDIGIVSQFDIQRLPEFAPRLSPGPGDNTIATCYIPVYAGSQIWFEYFVDSPHPFNASYFFKLLVNGHLVTSWDCTAKHGYRGKTVYTLSRASDHSNFVPAVSRHAIGFRSQEQEQEEEGGSKISNDFIEIRVHRIEYRRRIHEQSLYPAPFSVQGELGRLQLSDGGPLELGRPLRRYRYQLLDPVDEPYATFRFFCRDYDWLASRDLLQNPTEADCSITSASTVWHDPRTSSSNDDLSNFEPPAATSRLRRDHIAENSTEDAPSTIAGSDRVKHSSERDNSSIHDVLLPQSDSEESLSRVTRGSVEDLPSPVPRSPQSPSSARLSENDSRDGHIQERGMQRVGSKSPESPRRRLKKRMTSKFDRSTSNTTKAKQYPFRPFATEGFSQRIWSPVSAQWRVISDEEDANMVEDSSCGGRKKTLLGVLGRKSNCLLGG